MPVTAPRAVVIGGSMGGLFAALFLRRAGWEVDVYERVAVELSGRGAGIVTHPELLQAMEEAGVTVGDDLGVLIEERRTLDREGRVIAEARCPQVTTSWNTLFGMLRAEFPAERYHLGRSLARVEEGAERIAAVFADGSRAEADLIVAADGFRSTLRALYLPQVQPLYAGYVAWRGMVEEAALPERVQREVFPYFAFCLPPGEQMLSYPVAGSGNDIRPGHRRCNFVWYRPAEERGELARLLTDESGRTHELSIPPPLIARATLDAMRDAAERTLAPQFAEMVRATPEPFLQPIYDLESPRLAFGRAATVGDAAFVARPHVGAGVAKAAEDARALTRALAAEADVPAALARFERERLASGRFIVAQARRLGSYMRTRFESDEERALAERHQTPEAVMAETALLDFMRG